MMHKWLRDAIGAILVVALLTLPWAYGILADRTSDLDNARDAIERLMFDGKRGWHDSIDRIPDAFYG